MPRSPSLAGSLVSTTASQPRSVVYLALYDEWQSPGVHQKITGLLAAARDAGFATRLWAEPFTQPALTRMAAAIDAASETHIIVRSQGWANMFLWRALRGARRRGQHVIVDVPTPHRVGVTEVWRSRDTAWRRLRAVVAFVVSGPWPLWPATRIVQYAPEGAWFKLGNRARTIHLGNGIDVAAVEPRTHGASWPSPRLELVAVGSIARWQGYDRLLRAMRQFLDRSQRDYDVHVTIVGEGTDLAALREEARQLRLNDHVTFAGTVVGEQLRALYARAHLAISTLALHRKGLDEASELKAREYAAIGIPFIACGDDPDFPAVVPFRLRVSNDEGTGDLVNIFADFSRYHAQFDDAAEREYARQHLDWRRKLDAIGLT